VDVKLLSIDFHSLDGVAFPFEKVVLYSLIAGVMAVAGSQYMSRLMDYIGQSVVPVLSDNPQRNGHCLSPVNRSSPESLPYLELPESSRIVYETLSENPMEQLSSHKLGPLLVSGQWSAVSFEIPFLRH
tara:strand:- start:1243 stop:1629 length:387 start_codon:yes stop_codon:yes gene_type:complete